MRKKERLCHQGNPCLREVRKKFISGASTRQTSTIELGRGSLVGVGRVLKEPYVLSLKRKEKTTLTPCLRELRKKFISGASTRQSPPSNKEEGH